MAKARALLQDADEQASDLVVPPSTLPGESHHSWVIQVWVHTASYLSVPLPRGAPRRPEVTNG